MIPKSNASISEYQAWADSNPSLEELLVVRSATGLFAAIRKCVIRVRGIIKRIINRKGSLASQYKKLVHAPRIAHTEPAPTYFGLDGMQLHGTYNEWQEAIAIELSKTRDHIKRVSKLECIRGQHWAARIFDKKQAMIVAIELAEAQEQVLVEALEILSKTSK